LRERAIASFSYSFLFLRLGSRNTLVLKTKCTGRGKVRVIGELLDKVETD
jgi:hypothetical protein